MVLLMMEVKEVVVLAVVFVEVKVVVSILLPRKWQW